jgi:hypothetical protein
MHGSMLSVSRLGVWARAPGDNYPDRSAKIIVVGHMAS